MIGFTKYFRVYRRNRIMKKIITVLIIHLFFVVIIFAQTEKKSIVTNNWTGTIEQKISGLFTIWAQTKFAFPHRERLDILDWDSKVREFIPRIVEAKDIESYYSLLMELTSLLQDSHTEVVPPWGRFTPGFDIPAIELIVINDKFYIIRTGDTGEIRNQGIVPGMEILEVGDGIPISQYFQENVLRYYTRGSKRANNRVLVYYLLYGPKDSKIKLMVRDSEKKTKLVELTRNATSGSGPIFMYTFVKYSFANMIESRFLTDGILYVNLPNFQNENKKVKEDFLKLIDNTDPDSIKGMIIDLRYNLGGSHSILHPIVSRLIDSIVKTPTNNFFKYTAAYLPWGKEKAYSWHKQDWEVFPSDGKRYKGAIVLLIGPYTHSSAEDMVIELSQTGRCVTVGEPTAGGAGGGLSFSLPGGGSFAVSSFKATYPDGTDYMDSGIQPDYEIQTELEDILGGKDRVLEKAVEVLKKQKGK
jgi:carboxyl-terminal processing protease